MNRFNIFAVIIALFVVAALALPWFGAIRWQANTRELRTRLEIARQPMQPATFEERELQGLPAPVARYFRIALTLGQPLINAASIEHSGTVR